MKQLITSLIAFFIVSAAFAQDKPEGLFINSKAADFKLKDQSGNEVVLKDLRRKGPVVILFYRGNWSPYCMKELKRFQDSLSLITGKGGTVVAITPEGQQGIDSTVAKTGATFPIIYDAEMKLAKAYGVAFKVDDKALARYKNAGTDLMKLNGQKEVMLPVPAAYILNKEGSVTYRYFNEDYRKLVSVKEVLDNLK